MKKLTRCAFRIWSALVLSTAMTLAHAQSLPVEVKIAGNTATARVGLPLVGTLADVTLTFDQVSGLTPSSVGIRAQLVSLTDPLLRGRLPSLTQITSTLPLLITVEPPSAGGLSFRRSGRYELHTILLPYSVGSHLRVFKAPLDGKFRDITEEIASGSVRARSRYGGFSQFLVLVDLRATGTVVAAKISYLRTRIAMLPASEQPAFTTLLNAAESAIASGNYANAIVAIDSITARATARAGTYIPDVWRSSRDVENHAGELIAGAATLKFSVAYLRDYGQ